MASADDIRAENEGLCREIQALLCVNKSLEKEIQELRSECMEHESNKIKTLEHELEKVDEGLTYLHSQCRSMRDIIRRANADQEESDFVDRIDCV